MFSGLMIAPLPQDFDEMVPNLRPFDLADHYGLIEPREMPAAQMADRSAALSRMIPSRLLMLEIYKEGVAGSILPIR